MSVAVAFFVLVSLAAGAARGETETATRSRGAELYREHCARCHGVGGRGDGPAADSFDAAPVDLIGTAILRANSNERLAARILAGRRNWLESYRSRKIPARTPRTDALVRFLLRLPETDWEAVDHGKRLYRNRCVGCHGSFASETKQYPSAESAENVDDRHFAGVADAELARLARHDRSDLPRLAFPFSDEESADLASYLRRLSPGYDLYEQHCVACHGEHGRTPWLAFDQRYFRKLAPGELRERVWYMLLGLQASMPHFEETLTRQDVEAILAHLRSQGG